MKPYYTLQYRACGIGKKITSDSLRSLKDKARKEILFPSGFVTVTKTEFIFTDINANIYFKEV